MAEKTKKLSDRVRELMDALADAVESLLVPPPERVPVRLRPLRPVRKGRRR